MSKKRIIFVNPTKTFYGGAEKALLLLMKKVTRLNFESYLITPGLKDFDEQLVKLSNIKHFRAKFDYSKYIFDVIYLLKIFNEIKPDILFLNGRRSILFVWYYKILNPKVKILEWVHLPFIEKESNIIKAIFLMIIHMVPGKFVDKLYAVSHEIINERLKFMINKNCEYIYVPISKSEIMRSVKGLNKHLIRKTMGVNRKDILVIYVARVEKHKGQIKFVKYWIESGLVSKYPHIKFFFLGKGTDSTKLDEITNNIGTFKYLGHIGNIYKYLLAADVLLLLSTNEGLPMSILEAMSLGLPVITMPVGEIPFVIKNNENGFIVEKYDEVLNIIIDRKYSKLNTMDIKKVPQLCDENSTFKNMIKEMEMD